MLASAFSAVAVLPIIGCQSTQDTKQASHDPRLKSTTFEMLEQIEKVADNQKICKLMVETDAPSASANNTGVTSDCSIGYFYPEFSLLALDVDAASPFRGAIPEVGQAWRIKK
jgi:hypothetical protein